MYLEKLAIKNFRSFEAEDISFSPDLTVFVGENNGGKSNAIDAIRLITTPLSGRREIYCEATDVRFGSGTRTFEFEARYANLSVPQQGRFISAVADPSLENAIFGLSYEESDTGQPVRPRIWAGRLRGVPEPGCHDMVRHVYLPPLRDAKRSLASGNPTRIYALLNHFLAGENPDELAKRLSRSAAEPILGKVDSAVDIGLIALTSGVRRQAASLGFATNEKLIDIARDLRFRLADHGIQPEDLRYSGHGYANLLYIATIAVELEKASNADLTLFLVEEPEAHLHPQLQAAVLCFLEEQAERSKRPKGNQLGPAGELQVFVATHSPNLSAWVANNNLVFFKSRDGSVKPSDQDIAAAAPEAASAHREDPNAALAPIIRPLNEIAQIAAPTEPPPDGAPSSSVAPDTSSLPPLRRATHCIPLARLNLPAEDRRKIDRYLDVTESALLFGGRVLLVEGIAEALLLPIVAKKYVLSGKPDKLRVFRSAVFVPIDGVDFEPYVRLLLTAFDGECIADRVVVVTDGDGGKVDPGEALPGQERRRALEEIAKAGGGSKLLEVVTNTYSLESELVAAGNADLMKMAFIKLHPRSGEKWDDAVKKTGREQAIAIQTIFEGTRKGDFAQLLADGVATGEELKVPAYLVAAVEALVR